VNLLFLVEGEKTEPKVYRAWLKHLFPDLIFVERPEDMMGNTCRIVEGRGYPNMVSKPKNSSAPSRLEACLMDIENFKFTKYQRTKKLCTLLKHKLDHIKKI
jgi:hypothetical protein